MSTIGDFFKTGLEFHQRGDLRQAENVYRQVLQADPKHAEALHHLGMIALQRGDHALAVKTVSAAVRLDGRQPVFHATLGAAYRAGGDLDRAVGCYRQALRIEPNFAAAHSNLGALLQAQGDLTGAAAEHTEAIRQQPHDPRAHFNLALVRQLQGDLDAAATHYGEALRLDGGYHDARLGLGQVMHLQGQSADAASCFEMAARGNPQSAAAECGWGMACQAQGKLAEAIGHFQRAIQLDPRLAEAHCNLGVALREQCRFPEAVAAFQEAARVAPQLMAAPINLAGLFLSISRPDEAVAASRRAIEIDPASPIAFGYLGNALQAQGDIAGAIAAYRRTIELYPAEAAVHSNLVYALNFDPRYGAEQIFAEHLAWAARHAEPLTSAAPPHQRDRDDQRRLRIGYLSSHFREHAVSAFSEPMLAAHDHERFEIVCYHDSNTRDAVTSRFQKAADNWCDVAGKTDEQVASLIRADQVDILVDLAGHIGGNRLLVFARKPAPIAVTYLGYQNTTGMSAIDYRLTDAHADPPGVTEAYYTEQLFRLPRTFFCYRAPDPAPTVNSLPALSNGHVTFGSFNHLQKITPRVIDTWARILAAVPDARLLVLAYAHGRFERDMRAALARRGVDGGRLNVVDKRPHYEYLQLFQQVDVALDSFPFNGHTTVCDALWMGVPSIMLEGESYASRFGGSALVNLGLKDLIAQDIDGYVDIAVRLAAEGNRLSDLRSRLRAEMLESPLLDARSFVRNLEQAYRQMWSSWCRRD